MDGSAEKNGGKATSEVLNQLCVGHLSSSGEATAQVIPLPTPIVYSALPSVFTYFTLSHHQLSVGEEKGQRKPNAHRNVGVGHFCGFITERQ